MALIRAFAGALSGTFADQWLDIITVGQFDEHAVLMPGIYQETNRDRGSNTKHSEAVISNGSRIYVPENTAAFIFDQSGIENIITESGGYEYRTGGTDSVFAGNGIGKSIFEQIGERFKYGGEPVANKRIAFVNLREIRGIKFGTPAPLMYHDRFYQTDLEIRARGMMSVQVSTRSHSFASSCLRTWTTSASTTRTRNRRSSPNSCSRSRWRSTRCQTNTASPRCPARRIPLRSRSQGIRRMPAHGSRVSVCTWWA